MATDLVPTTELEAVNLMLSAIGEAPVNMLDSAGLADVGTAVRILGSTSRTVQARGWHFNTETDYPLLRNAALHIPVGANVLRIDTTAEFANYDVTQRGQELYDLKKHTLVFDRDLKGTLVFFLAFEEIPEAARWYIAVRAARLFSEKMLGDDKLGRFAAAEEATAYADLKEAEGDTGDYNVLQSNSVGGVLDRSV